MARAAYVVLCIAGMVGFWAIIHWMSYGFSRDFGMGFGVGGTFMAVISAAYLTLRYGE